MIISKDIEKAFDKIQYFKIKTINRLRIERNLLKDIYEKLIANTLNGESECFPVSLRTKEDCILSSLLLNTLLEVLASTRRKEKKKKKAKMLKRKKQKSLFIGDIIVDIRNPEESIK